MGKANTGKNTLARMIVSKLKEDKNLLGKLVGYFAFADPIKRMIREMFPQLPKKFLYGSSQFRNEIIPNAFKDNKPLTIRQLLIDLGSEVGRKYCNTVWLDNFDHEFIKFSSKRSAKIAVVTDVRFRNEFDHLKNKGFYMIRLYRDTKISNINHISETGQNDIKDEEFDMVLYNNKSLADLKKTVLEDIIPNLKE